VGDRCLINAGHICAGLNSLRTNADAVGFRRCSCVAAQVNVIAPAGEGYLGERAVRDVAVAAAQIVERADAAGGVSDAGGVELERTPGMSNTLDSIYKSHQRIKWFANHFVW